MQPFQGRGFFSALTQGSLADSATLGWKMQSLQDC
jgi:hypothetical protein